MSSRSCWTSRSCRTSRSSRTCRTGRSSRSCRTSRSGRSGLSCWTCRSCHTCVSSRTYKCNFCFRTPLRHIFRNIQQYCISCKCINTFHLEVCGVILNVYYCHKTICRNVFQVFFHNKTSRSCSSAIYTATNLSSCGYQWSNWTNFSCCTCCTCWSSS